MQKMLPPYVVLLIIALATNVATFSVIDPLSLSVGGDVEEGHLRPVNDITVRKFISPVLTASEFQTFKNGIEAVVDERCKKDLNTTLWSIVDGQHWAIAMYDATAKSAFGIESGVRYQFGHYDECLSQNFEEIPVRAKYCLMNVTMEGLTMQSRSSRQQQPTNQTIAYWGACVPASCSVNDIAIFLENSLQRAVAVDDNMCQVRESELHVTNEMLSYALVIFFFIFLAVLSTTYHGYLIYNRTYGDGKPNMNQNETLQMALLSFSIIENTKKIFQSSKDQLGLNSINGIKALAMCLILAGHALSFIYGGPVYNVKFMDEEIRRPASAFLSNSLLFVDVFLLLSGFLFCRILLIELERRRGKINVFILYLGRYIRLTPAYMAVISFYMTWFPHVGDGPIWQQRIGREQERCNSSWWLNILYINNYINTDKLCMFQSWYLSVDSQLFFVAPIFIYLLYKSRKHGFRALLVVVVITSAIPFLATWIKNLDPTLLIYSDEMNDLASNNYYVGSYIKTHMRASAYAIGLLTGFIVHLMQERGTKLSAKFVRCMWCSSIIIGVGSMFTVCRFYLHPYTNLESILYAGFHKVGWNLSVAWLVIAVTTGHAGWLQHFLSSRFFAPVSRLAYCAYLCNGIVELYASSSIRVPNFMGYVQLTNDVLSHILDTLAMAFIVCLLFESPIHALERILLRNANKSQRQGQDKSGKDSSRTPSTSEEQVA